MDFHPSTAAATTTDAVEAPAADAAVTFAATAAFTSPSSPSLVPTASPLPPIATPRWHRIMPRVAPGDDSSVSGLPTTVEGISSTGSSKFDYMIFLYSGAAACTADAVAFPFDTAKTRSVTLQTNLVCTEWSDLIVFPPLTGCSCKDRR